MLKPCKRCGAMFDKVNPSTHCPDCRPIVTRERKEKATLEKSERVKMSSPDQMAARCKTCKYQSSTQSGFKSCDYLLKTYTPRGCPPGDACTKYESRKKEATL